MSETTEPRTGADAAWEALREDIRKAIVPRMAGVDAIDITDAHRPLIEAAIEAQAAPLDVDVLARAWLNAMTNGDHNERCLIQSPEHDCPVGAEVRDFVPKVATIYRAILAGEVGRE